jgi:hypothetical protein
MEYFYSANFYYKEEGDRSLQKGKADGICTAFESQANLDVLADLRKYIKEGAEKKNGVCVSHVTLLTFNVLPTKSVSASTFENSWVFSV